MQDATSKYMMQRFLGRTRGELMGRWNGICAGYELCFDGGIAEGIILERMSHYAPDGMMAHVPAGGCDFTGEIRNMITGLSGRAAHVERALEDARQTIAQLEGVEEKNRKLENMVANYRSQIADAETSLSVFDEGRTSEYWERHHPQPL